MKHLYFTLMILLCAGVVFAQRPTESNQNTKANDAEVIHKTGDETKTGNFTLTRKLILDSLKFSTQGVLNFGSFAGNTRNMRFFTPTGGQGIGSQLDLEMTGDGAIWKRTVSFGAAATTFETDLLLASGNRINGNVVPPGASDTLVLKSFYRTGDLNLVHKTGDEPVEGIKTFVSSPVIPKATANNQPATFEQLNSGLDLKADKAITINGHSLSANVSVSKGDVGLGNADNTGDLNKPVSTATQAALDIKANKATTLAGYGISDAVLSANVVHNTGDESIAGVKSFTGKIGIGVSNPGVYQLAVKGTIRTQAIKVDPSTWADYVFEKSYKLPALSDVEKFVQENRHLPDVPSEAEVKKNGIELGDMNALLLKKIEELTLYMIEKDKEVKELKSRLDKLEKK